MAASNPLNGLGWPTRAESQWRQIVTQIATDYICLSVQGPVNHDAIANLARCPDWG